MSNQLTFLNGDEVSQLLKDDEHHILSLVQQAYLAYHQGNATMAESTFLRFPNRQKERIISLPAYLGAPYHCAGIKWISSFPDNLSKNIERASAIFVLNSLETGHPIAVMESSIISAKRTAAGAALTAKLLTKKTSNVTTIAIIGTGLINFETIHFLTHLFPNIHTININDLSAERSSLFKHVLNKKYKHINIVELASCTDCFTSADIVSIATTAIKPYISDIGCSSPVILHTSLRDLSPEILLKSHNIVDDLHHALSANTSLGLAKQMDHSNQLITSTIGELITNGKDARIKDNEPIIASPFGMGILDLIIANYLYQKAKDHQIGTIINNFIPTPWFNQYL